MIAVGIDPDTKTTGVATVERTDDGELRVLFVGLFRAKGRKTADRRIEMAYELEHLCQYGLKTGRDIDAIVVEWMKLRPTGEKRPNNIVDLNGISGMCVSAAVRMRPRHVFTPIPWDWKKNIPKKIHQARVIRRLGLTMDLTDVPGAKQVPASMRQHVIDAIGMAVWALEPTGPIFLADLDATSKK